MTGEPKVSDSAGVSADGVSRKSRGFKNDRAAIDIYGAAYAAIPKSVLALVAFYFAQRVADDFSDDASALSAIAEEVRILAENGIITPGQRQSSLRAISRARGDSQ